MSINYARRTRVTRLGWMVLGSSLAIGLAAMNTGNNLLYMALGALLGLVMASGLLSDYTLWTLDADWLLPAELVAESPATVRVRLRHDGRWLPAGSVRVHLVVAPPVVAWPVVARPDVARPLGRESQAKAWATTAAVAPRSVAAVDLAITPSRRGRLRLDGLVLQTRFPFGLFEKTARVDLEADLIAYPAPRGRPALPPVPRGPRPERAAGRAGPGESPRTIRDYLRGDPAKLMDWKATARRDTLMVRELEREEERRIVIELFPAVNFDAAVERAADLVREADRAGLACGLLAGPRSVEIRPASATQKRALLTALALVEAGEVTGTGPSAPSWAVGAETIPVR